MENNRHIHFLSETWKEKMVYQNGENKCPFCNREELEDVLDQDGSILLVKNKFATIADAFQTVLIETDDCSASMATYDREHMRRVISFGIDHWLAMEKSGEFRSVLFYKNHGPQSGGSIDHAHMQIVGLKKIDYKQTIREDIFEGIEIDRKTGSLLNLSTKPYGCAIEFNILTTPRNDVFMADTAQRIVTYILEAFRCSSYNLFFYQWNESIVCKVVPRWISSPFLVGYSISQTSDRLQRIAEDVRERYYSG